MGPGHLVTAPEERSAAADRNPSLQARRVLTPAARFERAARLTRTADLRRLLQEGRRRRRRYLEFVWTKSKVGHARMGLIVPKFHHTAVARNRLRRRIREVWRVEVRPDQGDLDLVIRARREAYRATRSALKTELLEWRDAVRTAT